MKPQELIQNIGSSKEAGIYMILCIPTNKALIGSSRCIRHRWTQHRYMLKKGRHENQHLQHSYNKYGKDCLAYLVIENCEKELLRAREAHFINALDKELKMNLIAVTEATETSPETKEKMSRAKKGQIPWNKGKVGVYSQETLDNMSKAKENYTPWMKGKKMTEEQRKKLSDKAKLRTIIRGSNGRITSFRKEGV
jgi:group I intron endonuclease